ncbi:MAG: Asp23/Gls24 family envelope stress response protein [Oscillospiraceae bacterium]|nr:Asp23/Gls24 family envelope stress response protein [Oscillospiraceae bacterium]
MQNTERTTHTNGSFKVSEEVVAKIARLAASEVEGVALEPVNAGRLARQGAGASSVKPENAASAGKIAQIAHAAKATSVAGFTNVARIARAAKIARPVRVRLTKEAAEIDIAIIALQGSKAAVTGENVQRAVKSAVQNMTGIAVSKVNVRIAGIRLAETVV